MYKENREFTLLAAHHVLRINQFLFLFGFLISAWCCLLRGFPAIELCNDLRVDSVKLLLGEDTQK